MPKLDGPDASGARTNQGKTIEYYEPITRWVEIELRSLVGINLAFASVDERCSPPNEHCGDGRPHGKNRCATRKDFSRTPKELAPGHLSGSGRDIMTPAQI